MDTYIDNTKYEILKGVYNNWDDLINSLRLGNKPLIDNLLNRYNRSSSKDTDFKKIISLLGIYDLTHFDTEYVGDIDSLVTKLPYPSRGTVKLLLIIFILETIQLLPPNHNFIIIKSTIMQEFKPIISDDTYEILGWIGTIKELISTCGIVALLNRAMPDYTKIDLTDSQNNYWPFNNSVIDMLKQGLSTYTFNKGKALKLSLVDVDNYQDLLIHEAIATLMLKELLERQKG